MKLSKNTNERKTPSAFFQIGLVIFLFLGFQLLGATLYQLFVPISDMNVELDRVVLPLSERNMLRVSLMINNAFMFLFPGLLFSYIVYKNKWLESVGVHKRPIFAIGLVGIIAVAGIYPFLVYMMELGESWSTPEWMEKQEAIQKATLTAAFYMEHFSELLFCLFVAALLPAIGEEWVFRGILQKKLFQTVKNQHFAVWLTAIIFSAMHLQFHAFIPMMILGVMLGYMAIWTQNLWIPIIVHFVNNAYTLIHLYIYPPLSSDSVGIQEVFLGMPWWQASLYLLAGIVVMIFLRRFTIIKVHG